MGRGTRESGLLSCCLFPFGSVVHYPYTLVVGPVVALLVVDVWTNEKRPAEC
jgi:hypothetical protein